MLRTLILAALVSTVAACTGTIDGPGGEPGDPVDPNGPFTTIPDADECEDVDPHLALPLRRMDPDEYVAVFSSLVGRNMAGELRASGEMGASGGMLRNDVAAGMTTSAVEAMMADSVTIAEALIAPDAAARFDDCAAGGTTDRACAERFIGALAAQAFRRPVTTAEVGALMSTFDASGERGLTLAIRRVLLAPETIYRPELGEGTGELRKLTAHELASRLSFTLTGQPPSAELTAAAVAGELDSASSRREWAERLVFEGDAPTDVAREHLGKLFYDWLQLADLGNLDGSDSNPDLPQRWRDETMAFVEEVIFARRGGTEMLLDGGFAMLDETLATEYGEEGVSGGDTLRAVNSETRRGLLQQGAFLARTWAGPRTAIHRGVYLIRRFFCDSTGNPPEEADEFVAPEMGSERERLGETETNANCSSCHAKINPLGYAFMEFGEHGQTRTEDEFGFPIESDARVSWVDSEVSNSVDLSSRMAQNEQVRACVSQWVFNFASGRRLERAEPADACQLRVMAEQPATVDQLFDYVASEAFTHNRIESGESQ